MFASFATVILPSETEVFAAADAGLTIWHNDNAQETYELSGANASLFAVDVNGGVRTASDLSSSEDDLLYELTLRLTDGAAIAERLLTLALLPPPIAVDVEVECAGQWPCRDQFAAALSAAIESGEATLDHERAVVVDRGNKHGNIVRSTFQAYGSGASVSLTIAPMQGRGLGSTFPVFSELPARKKHIITHAIGRPIGALETIEEKEAIITQSSGNRPNLRFPDTYVGAYLGQLNNDPNYVNSALFISLSVAFTDVLDTGLMIVVGGIGSVQDSIKKYNHALYCSRDLPYVSLSGEEYCSRGSHCGFAKNNCLVGNSQLVVYDAENDLQSSGTSLSAPQAAAALQMLSTMWPELSQRELALMLLELADDIGEAGIDDVYGHGALSFRRLYAPGGLSPFMAGGEAFRFSCDANANTCQKERL